MGRPVVGEGKLLTGRGFSCWQTRMQRRSIRSGWNFADRRIWLLLFLVFQFVLFGVPVCAWSIIKMEISFATSNEIQVFVWNRYNLIIEIIA